MDILNLLNSDLGKQVINGVAGSTGQDSSKTGSILSMALPVVMKAIQRNVSSPEGAMGLIGALGKHDGSVLDNVQNAFEGGNSGAILEDGGKILNHILGDKSSNIFNAIGQKTGVESGATANVVKMAMPLLMGFIGKQFGSSNESGVSGITNLIGGMLGGESSGDQSVLEKFLDADGDGSIVDDLAGMVMGGNQKGGKSGGILGDIVGGLFGK